MLESKKEQQNFSGNILFLIECEVTQFTKKIFKILPPKLSKFCKCIKIYIFAFLGSLYVHFWKILICVYTKYGFGNKLTRVIFHVLSFLLVQLNCL